jgi:Ankyrin repeats (3 copies)
MDATTPLAVLLRGHGLRIGSPMQAVCTLASLFSYFADHVSKDVCKGVAAIAVIRRGVIVSFVPVADAIAAAVACGADVHTSNDYALRWAAHKGQTQAVRVLLAAGADVHADKDDALRYASSHGCIAVVQLLLDAGANIHAEDDAALYYAALNGQYKVVELLLSRGAGNIGKALVVAKHGIVKRLLADEAHRLPVFRALTAM